MKTDWKVGQLVVWAKSLPTANGQLPPFDVIGSSALAKKSTHLIRSCLWSMVYGLIVHRKGVPGGFFPIFFFLAWVKLSQDLMCAGALPALSVWISRFIDGQMWRCRVCFDFDKIGQSVHQ